jgi:hypothetical protein
MIVARTGPTSPMSAKNSRKASAVQTTARIRTANRTWPDSIVLGSCGTASGA